MQVAFTVAERVLYTPSIGFVMLLTIAIDAVINSNKNNTTTTTNNNNNNNKSMPVIAKMAVVFVVASVVGAYSLRFAAATPLSLPWIASFAARGTAMWTGPRTTASTAPASKYVECYGPWLNHNKYTFTSQLIPHNGRMQHNAAIAAKPNWEVRNIMLHGHKMMSCSWRRSTTARHWSVIQTHIPRTLGWAASTWTLVTYSRRSRCVVWSYAITSRDVMKYHVVQSRDASHAREFIHIPVLLLSALHFTTCAAVSGGGAALRAATYLLDDDDISRTLVPQRR